MFITSRRKFVTLKNCAICSIAILFGLFVTFFFASHVPVPWGDGIDAVELYMGSSGVRFITLPVNEHFAIIPRLLTLFDLSLGNVNFKYTAIATLTLYVIQFYIICRYLVFVDQSEWNWWIAAVIAITSFATYRLIAISNPINNAHFLVGFFVFLAVLSFAAQRKTLGKQKKFLFITSLSFAGLAILTLANGILALPIILLLHLRCLQIFRKQPVLTRIAAVGIMGLAGILAFSALVVFLYKSNQGYSDPNNVTGALWFYFRATGLPFTGVSAGFFAGLLFAGITNILAIFYLIRIFVTTEEDLTHNVAIGLILYSVLSLMLVAFFRHEHYPDFFSHGHRYGVFNLFLHAGLFLLVGADLKQSNLAQKFRLLLQNIILVAAIICAIGSVIIGDYLIERKNNFVKVAESLASNQPVDRELFHSLAFYPSIWWSKRMYAEFVKRGLY